MASVLALLEVADGERDRGNLLGAVETCNNFLAAIVVGPATEKAAVVCLTSKVEMLLKLNSFEKCIKSANMALSIPSASLSERCLGSLQQCKAKALEAVKMFRPALEALDRAMAVQERHLSSADVADLQSMRNRLVMECSRRKVDVLRGGSSATPQQPQSVPMHALHDLAAFIKLTCSDPASILPRLKPFMSAGAYMDTRVDDLGKNLLQVACEASVDRAALAATTGYDSPAASADNVLEVVQMLVAGGALPVQRFGEGFGMTLGSVTSGAAASSSSSAGGGSTKARRRSSTRMSMSPSSIGDHGGSSGGGVSGMRGDWEMATPLHLLAFAGAEQTVRFLSSPQVDTSGTALYQVDLDGWTPLMATLAPYRPRTSGQSAAGVVVAVLSSLREAVVNRQKTANNSKGRENASSFSKRADSAVYRMLCHTNNRGMNAVHLACLQGDLLALEALLTDLSLKRVLAMLQVRCSQGFTPMMWALIGANGRRSTVAAWLVTYCRQPSVHELTDNNGEETTPLYMTMIEDVKIFRFALMMSLIHYLHNHIPDPMESGEGGDGRGMGNANRKVSLLSMGSVEGDGEFHFRDRMPSRGSLGSIGSTASQNSPPPSSPIGPNTRGGARERGSMNNIPEEESSPLQGDSHEDDAGSLEEAPGSPQGMSSVWGLEADIVSRRSTVASFLSLPLENEGDENGHSPDDEEDPSNSVMARAGRHNTYAPHHKLDDVPSEQEIAQLSAGVAPSASETPLMARHQRFSAGTDSPESTPRGSPFSFGSERHAVLPSDTPFVELILERLHDCSVELSYIVSYGRKGVSPPPDLFSDITIENTSYDEVFALINDTLMPSVMQKGWSELSSVTKQEGVQLGVLVQIYGGVLSTVKPENAPEHWDLWQVLVESEDTHDSSLPGSTRTSPQHVMHPWGGDESDTDADESNTDADVDRSHDVDLHEVSDLLEASDLVDDDEDEEGRDGGEDASGDGGGNGSGTGLSLDVGETPPVLDRTTVPWSTVATGKKSSMKPTAFFRSALYPLYKALVVGPLKRLLPMRQRVKGVFDGSGMDRIPSPLTNLSSSSLSSSSHRQAAE